MRLVAGHNELYEVYVLGGTPPSADEAGCGRKFTTRTRSIGVLNTDKDTPLNRATHVVLELARAGRISTPGQGGIVR
jgi:hypothetical protein